MCSETHSNCPSSTRAQPGPIVDPSPLNPVGHQQQQIIDDKVRTLLPAGLLNLRRKTVAHLAVVWLELLERLAGVVDEGETSALATTVLGAETKDGNAVLVALVQLGQLLAELVLGHVGAVWVQDVTAELC